MQRRRGRFLLVRVGSAEGVRALVYDDGAGRDEPATVSARLADLHDLPEDRDGVVDLVLLDAGESPAAQPSGVVLRAADAWAPGGPSAAEAARGELVTHPRTGTGSRGDDDRLRGAARARSGGYGAATDAPRAAGLLGRVRQLLGSGPATAPGHRVTLRLWWAVPSDRAVEAWATVSGADGRPLSWPVLDVPPRFVGASLPATCEQPPTAGEYVSARLHGPDGDVDLRPAGRARDDVQPLQPEAH